MAAGKQAVRAAQIMEEQTAVEMEGEVRNRKPLAVVVAAASMVVVAAAQRLVKAAALAAAAHPTTHLIAHRAARPGMASIPVITGIQIMAQPTPGWAA